MARIDELANSAERILAWARANRALSEENLIPPLGASGQVDVFPALAPGTPEFDDIRKAERTLERLKITAVLVDAERDKLAILTKNQITASTLKALPAAIDGITVEYVGHAGVVANPPVFPQNAGDSAPRCFMHNGRMACGTSVTAAPIPGAGTFGAIVTLGDGELYGLTNNHVTGGCNHTRGDMHIMCPAPCDADPDHVPPTAIGKHYGFTPLASGDVRQVPLQELDVALFRITKPDLVTSMQGEGEYDTPTAIKAPAGGMMVKKVGRTTGLTVGQVLGVSTTAFGIPYRSPHFSSTVYFRNVWAIVTPTGDPFSSSGDSGSLVVTGDGRAAVGLIFAGGDNVSYILPIEPVLNEWGATLVSGHGT